MNNSKFYAVDSERGLHSVAIMIAENSQSFQSICEALDEMNVSCVFCSPVELKALVTAHDPILVLVDHEVIDGDGIDFCSELRNSLLDMQVPLVYLTNNEDPSEMVRAFEAGVSNIFVNSRCSELIDYLRQILESPNVPLAESVWDRGNILMVEDEDFVADALKIALIQQGHEVNRLADGSRMLSEVDRLQPDILLLDLNLPGRSGFELIAELKSSRRHRHIPIIVTSGQTDRDCVLKALRLGAEDYVRKPFDMAELSARIRNLVRIKSMHDLMKRSRIFWHDHDELTGLVNKSAMASQIRQRLVAGQSLALLIVDIDDFHRIDHGIGDKAGEVALIRVADCLNKTLPMASIIARIEGAKFAVVMKTTSRGRVELAADLIAKSLARPLYLGGQEVYLRASIGVCMAPSQATSFSGAFRCASLAVQEAAISGGRACFFDNAMDENRRIEMTLEKDILHAIERNEMRVVFQPKVDLESQMITGAEALLRWQHPKYGWISPLKMIPIAERNLAIIPIGKWVVRQACKFWLACDAIGRADMTVAINLSAKQFRDRNLVNDIMAILRQEDVPTSAIELEITESCSMENVDATQKTLTELKQLGFRLAVDDFGTGYSSLSYLTRFPIDTLKIDRSFVMNVPCDTAASAVAAGIVSLAKSLSLTCVAEGVETEQQLEFLRSLGCTTGQGYLFSKPLEMAQVLEKLRKDVSYQRMSA